MNSWSRALELARATPESRNRYVDALRAASILVVVYGHWLAAAPVAQAEGGMDVTHLLAVAPASHWLTWVIQVMPVFFFVGGFSNGVSWRAARRRGTGYGPWLDGRMRRLVGPALPLVVAWTLLGVGGHLAGLHPAWATIGSQLALIPIWFLAVYLGIALLVPVGVALWERHGWGSVVGPLVLAGLLDAAFFTGTLADLAWANYLLVWFAVHQLGLAWLDGRLAGRAPLALAAVGAVGLALAVGLGPYPVSMVGVPGDAVSNTTPPKLVLALLACLQVGLLLAAEPWARKRLASERTWAAVVLVNGMIMSVFLWHMTVLVLVVGLAHLLGDPGLTATPGSGAWWALKPVWLVGWTVGLLTVVPLVVRFERAGSAGARVAPVWCQVVGALAIVAGLALVALGGIAGDGPLGTRPEVLLPILGGALLGMPRPGRA